MEKFQLLENAYSLCGKQPDKYVSDYFKKFIGKSFPQKVFKNPLRKAMLTGYFLRWAENLVNQKSLNEPDQTIKDILNQNENDFEKIEKIANYLDDHDKIGLSKKVFNYSLISSEDIEIFFE